MTDDPKPAVSVSVIVCVYTEERWDDIVGAIASCAEQTYLPAEVVAVVDYNDALFARLSAHAAGSAGVAVRVIENTRTKGLSGARNTGVEAAVGEVVAFLDDDARADPVWIEKLMDVLGRPRVAGVGGKAVPNVVGKVPRWWPQEFNWVIGCSYVGLPVVIAPVRNVIGCNMAFWRETIVGVEGFADGIGRVGKVPLGCEETDLCIRIRAADPDALILYAPGAVVHHRVTQERLGWNYFRRRCYSEGLSKALVAQRNGRDTALSSERTYVTRTLPRAAWRCLSGARTPGRMAELAAIVGGFAITSVGFVAGTVKDRLKR